MAEFTADLNPKQNSMSLGDMMKMGLYSAEASIARVQASQAQQELKELQPVRAFMSNPENYSTDGKLDPDKAAPALMAIAPLTGPKHLEKLQTLASNQITIADAKLGLTTKERQVFAQVDGALGQAKETDPNAYINAYKTIAAQYSNNPDIAKLAEAKISNVKLAGQGDHQWQQAQRSANTMMTVPESQAAFAPKATTAKIGGADVPVVSQPSVEGRTPTITPTQFSSGTGGYTAGGTTGATAPKPTTEETGKRMPAIINYGTGLKYTGDPSLFNLNDAQKAAYEIGDKNVNSIAAGIKAARDIEQPIRKVEEFINSASGSKLYQTLQAGGKYAWGNSEFDALVKNVAQVQARNAATMGLERSDHAQDLNAKLSGSEKIDPKALAGVMQQVKADATAAEKYNLGLKKFVEKNGDINGRILQQKFQSAWADHYDPRIFQIQNIESSNLPQKEQEKRVREIYSSMTPEEHTKLEGDAKVLYRLEKGLYQ
jgi:hypothetical protein